MNLLFFFNLNKQKTRKPLPVERVNKIWETCKDMGLLLGKGGLYGNVKFNFIEIN